MRQLLNLITLPFILLFVFLGLFSSCQKDDLTIDDPQVEENFNSGRSYTNVDRRLWIYYQRFEEEAAKRNIRINLNQAKISGEIAAIDEEHVAGQCTFHSQRPNHVTIDLGFWNRANDLFREFIIFHELGHCFLGRGHREDAFANGICKSLMRSGVEDCRDNYRNSTRTAYLDELFRPSSVQ